MKVLKNILSVQRERESVSSNSFCPWLGCAFSFSFFALLFWSLHHYEIKAKKQWLSKSNVITLKCATQIPKRGKLSWSREEIKSRNRMRNVCVLYGHNNARTCVCIHFLCLSTSVWPPAKKVSSVASNFWVYNHSLTHYRSHIHTRTHHVCLEFMWHQGPQMDSP